MKDNSIINRYKDQKTRNKQGRCKIREPKWAETIRESKKVISPGFLICSHITVILLWMKRMALKTFSTLSITEMFSLVKWLLKKPLTWMRLLLDVNRGQRLCAIRQLLSPYYWCSICWHEYIRHYAEMVIIKLNKEPWRMSGSMLTLGLEHAKIC